MCVIMYRWIYCISVGYSNIFYSIIMVCMEIPLGEGPYHIETSQFRWFTNQSTGWFLAMVWAFAFGFFRLIFLKCKYHSIIAILFLCFILLFIILLGYYFIFSDFICRLYRYLYIFCLDGYYTWTALVLLVESMFSHNFFIVSDIVNASEKQKYISVGRVVG